MKKTFHLHSLYCILIIIVLLTSIECSIIGDPDDGPDRHNQATPTPEPPSTTGIIPDERRIDWCPGITNGIPLNSGPVIDVKAVYGIVGDGITDDTAALKNAVASCNAGEVLFLPAGSYVLSDTIEIKGKPLILRGEGYDKTRLLFDNTNDSCIKVYEWSSSIQTSALSGFIKDSQSITVADASSFTVGDAIMIEQENDPDILTYGVLGTDSWGANAVGQIIKISGITGNTLTLHRGLYYTYNAGMNPRIKKINTVQGVGIEDLYIERRSGEGTGYNIEFVYAAHCWVKNIWSERCKKGHIIIRRSYGNVVRDSYFNDAHSHTGGGNGYGVEVREKATDNLVENNVFVHLRHAIALEVGACGNVFGYNYSREPYTSDDPLYLMGDLNLHGHYSYMNLFEGNRAACIRADNIWGTNAYTTFLRNQIERPDEHVRTGHNAVYVEKNNVFMNFIGNVLTHENANDDNATGGVWYIDEESDTSTLRHGNYDYITNTTEWDASITIRDIPASLYLNEKPEFFGNSPWPVTGPDCMDVGDIPAYTRYITY